MLTPELQNQLVNWRNGPFIKIFSHIPGDGKAIAAFMAATAGKGPTFILMNVSGSAYGVPSNLPPQIIGGFNPQSWVAGTVTTPTNAGRTAFIYNLTSTTIQRQNLVGQGAVDSGKIQTIASAPAIGFAFGSGNRGFDLRVDVDLNNGTAQNFGYGGTGGAPITFGGSDVDPVADSFQIAQLEVYACQ